MNKIEIPAIFDNDIKYFIKDNKIYYTPGTEIKMADLETFELYIGWFAKDKNNCYFEGSVFKKADVETFEVLNWAFAKDKNHVYTNRGILKNADPKTFVVMGDGYYKNVFANSAGFGKDEKHIFYYVNGTKTMVLKDADVKTFVAVTNFFGKDNNFVFWNGKKFKNANPKTWGLLDKDAFSTDEKNVYLGEELLKGTETFIPKGIRKFMETIKEK